MDPNIAYDSITLEELAFQCGLPTAADIRPLPRRYKSNWRVLHVDGFEGGRTIQWFGYTGPDLRRVELIPAPPLRPGQQRLRVL